MKINEREKLDIYQDIIIITSIIYTNIIFKPNTRPANPRIEAEKALKPLKLQIKQLCFDVRQLLDNVVNKDKRSEIEETVQRIEKTYGNLGKGVNDIHRADDFIGRLLGILQDIES